MAPSPSIQTIFLSGLAIAIPRAIDEQCPIEPTVRKSLKWGSLLFSLICQLGDITVSYYKRKNKVKDTGKLLPGHGGLLDRIDGILLGLPAGIIIYNLLTF